MLSYEQDIHHHFTINCSATWQREYNTLYSSSVSVLTFDRLCTKPLHTWKQKQLQFCLFAETDAFKCKGWWQWQLNITLHHWMAWLSNLNANLSLSPATTGIHLSLLLLHYTSFSLLSVQAYISLSLSCHYRHPSLSPVTTRTHFSLSCYYWHPSLSLLSIQASTSPVTKGTHLFLLLQQAPISLLSIQAPIYFSCYYRHPSLSLLFSYYYRNQSLSCCYRHPSLSLLLLPTAVSLLLLQTAVSLLLLDSSLSPVATGIHLSLLLLPTAVSPLSLETSISFL